MSIDLVEGWFRELPRKLQRELAGRVRTRVDRARDILADAAPVVKAENVREHVEPGALKASVQVRRKRNELDLEITAGGAQTTREVRAGSGEAFDYAKADEFGTEHQPARPWFFSTWNAGLGEETRQGIEDDVADIVSRA